MSGMPPLPPKYQAILDRKYPEVMETLDAFVRALREDPKRDPGNDPDYFNTVFAMLLRVEQERGESDTTRSLAALAFIQLADTGWAPPDREPVPPLEAASNPEPAGPQAPAAPQPYRLPRALQSIYVAAFAAAIAVGLAIGYAWGAM